MLAHELDGARSALLDVGLLVAHVLELFSLEFEVLLLSLELALEFLLIGDGVLAGVDDGVLDGLHVLEGHLHLGVVARLGAAPLLPVLVHLKLLLLFLQLVVLLVIHHVVLGPLTLLSPAVVDDSVLSRQVVLHLLQLLPGLLL